MLTESFLCFNQGFITILNYILNYYPGVDTELRDPRGFTALIKAGLQGREDCVSALLMHGKFQNITSNLNLSMCFKTVEMNVSRSGIAV